MRIKYEAEAILIGMTQASYLQKKKHLKVNYEMRKGQAGTRTNANNNKFKTI